MLQRHLNDHQFYFHNKVCLILEVWWQVPGIVIPVMAARATYPIRESSFFSYNGQITLVWLFPSGKGFCHFFLNSFYSGEKVIVAIVMVMLTFLILIAVAAFFAYRYRQKIKKLWNGRPYKYEWVPLYHCCFYKIYHYFLFSDLLTKECSLCCTLQKHN